MAPASVQHVTLPSGTLTLEVESGTRAVGELLDFAVRRNPRRGFLLVSLVLGKHVPVRPQTAQQTWDDLAAMIGDLTQPHFIGLAETATALGEGVARAWSVRHPTRPMTYQHSTRYATAAPLLLTFEEPHSHAPAHLLYDPGPGARAARELVLIDDEISTGTTLLGLARAWHERHPHLERVILVSLADWCADRAALTAALEVPVHPVSLLRGHHTFTPDPAWRPPQLPAVTGTGTDKSSVLAPHSARLGHHVDVDAHLITALAESCLSHSRPVLVLGTGEYQFPAAQLALGLEARGLDTRWSATTRSPVLPGLAITRAIEFTDNVRDGIPNYLYNVDPSAYSAVFVCYEGRCAPDPTLLAQLGPQARAVRLT